MAAETKSIWIELSEAITHAAVYVIGISIAFAAWVFNRLQTLAKRISLIEQRQAVDDEKFVNVLSILSRIERKLDEYDKNINDFWKNNPGLK